MTTTLRSAVSDAAARLAAAGVASPEHDARALALHVLGLARPSDLLLVERIEPPQRSALDDLVARRAQRVPLQHLTGRVGFRHLELDVGPGVFVPRPETEVVVQWVVDALQHHPHPLVVDLCTGSGAIALSLAHELPRATVHAVELDADALSWARRNAEGLASSATFHHADLAEALHELDGQVDVVVSNPPYVPTDERHLVDPEVVEHDPDLALFAGPDGLDVIRAVERRARDLLKPGGGVVVEHSDRQGGTAPEVFGVAGGWSEVEDHRDLTGRDRFVTATRTRT